MIDKKIAAMIKLFDAWAAGRGLNINPKSSSEEDRHLGAPYYIMPFYELRHAIDYNTYEVEYQVFSVDEEGNRRKVTNRMTAEDMEKYLRR